MGRRFMVCGLVIALFVAHGDGVAITLPDVEFETEYYIKNLYVHDMDGDLANDVFIGGQGYTYPDTGGFELHLQTPPGNYSSTPDTVVKAGYNGSPTTGADAGDFDGDTDMDVAGGGYYDLDRGFLYYQDVWPTFTYQHSLETTNPQLAEAGDFDGDTRMDISICEPVSGRIQIWLQQIAGGFTTSPTYRISPNPDWPHHYLREYTIGDLNDDGLLDILLAYTEREDSSSHAVSRYFTTAIFYQPATGWPSAFSDTTEPDTILLRYAYSTSIYSTGIGIGDLNGDTLNDVAVLTNANYPGGISLLTFLNTPTGMPTTPSQIIPTSGTKLAHHFADVDGDTLQDILIGNPVRVYFQTSSDTFPWTPGFTTSTNARELVIADMDNDGDNDIVGGVTHTVYIWFDAEPAGVEEREVRSEELEVRLFQNYPNPFVEKTVIRVWGLGISKKAVLKIYDLAGRMIKNWDLEIGDCDFHEVVWDGRDNTGKEVKGGVYFYKLIAGDFVSSKKLIWLK